MQLEEKERLYIPQGLNTNKEFLQGFEFKALPTMLIIFVMLNVPNIIITIVIKNILFCIFYLTISFIFSAMLIMKDSAGTSMLDIIIFFIKYSKSQKEYKYISEKEWSGGGNY